MKTKIASFYWIAILFALVSATSVFAESEDGFYEKDHVRPFISISGDYRGMFGEFQKYVNKTAFWNGSHAEKAVNEDGDTVTQVYSGKLRFSKFDNYYIGLHVNVGAQYKQLLTWIDFNFMPTQVSERASSTYDATAEDGSSLSFPVYNVSWFTYGADWMFGYKIFGENTFINLIPAVGFGLNLINFHFASDFDVMDVESSKIETTRDRYYSTIASTFNAELELRLEFGPFGIGAYGGYRFVRYNELNVEGMRLVEANGYDYGTDNVGDTWFVGLRLNWLFHSDWQNKQSNRL